MGEETIVMDSSKGAAVSNTQTDVNYAVTTAQNALSMPSPRYGSQAYFWTTEWQQKERLADFDFLIGDVYEPTDVDDLIRELHQGD